MIKKNFNLLIFVSALFVLTLSSCSKDEATAPQGDTFLASTTESNMVALIEDFTGVRCGYCPDGHVKAKAIVDANPGKVVVLCVHGGSYAAPATGWPNYTTPFGDALISQAKVSGFPAGTVSRRLASLMGITPQVSGGYAMSRSYWAAGCANVMAIKAPVNIGAKATFNSSSRLLTVKVDLYYTGEVLGSNNINVALVQDKIYGRQSGGTPDPENYEQNNVLRNLITGQWGDEFTTTGQSKGTKVSKTYTYTIPTDYNGTSADGGGAVVINNLRVVVFVTNGRVNVLNAKSIDVQ